MAHTMVVLSLALQPAQPAAEAPAEPLWVTWGDTPDVLEVEPMCAPAALADARPALLPSPEPPSAAGGDIRILEDAPRDMLVIHLHDTPEADPGVASTSYWMNVRAAIQAAARWPDTLRVSTSVLLRLQATPSGCVVLDPPPGEPAADAARAAARRASERVAREPDEEIPPQAELAVRFELNQPTRRQP